MDTVDLNMLRSAFFLTTGPDCEEPHTMGQFRWPRPSQGTLLAVLLAIWPRTRSRTCCGSAWLGSLPRAQNCCHSGDSRRVSST